MSKVKIIAFLVLCFAFLILMYAVGLKHGREIGIYEMLKHEGEGFAKGYQAGLKDGMKKEGAEHG